MMIAITYSVLGESSLHNSVILLPPKIMMVYECGINSCQKAP
jgi:hypothetical protein